MASGAVKQAGRERRTLLLGAAVLAVVALAVLAIVDVEARPPMRLPVLAMIFPAVFGVGFLALGRLAVAPARGYGRVALVAAVLLAALLMPPDGGLAYVAWLAKNEVYLLWVFVLKPLDLGPLNWVVGHTGLLWVSLPAGAVSGAVYGLVLGGLMALAGLRAACPPAAWMAAGGAVAGLASDLVLSLLAQHNWPAWGALGVLAAGYLTWLLLAPPRVRVSAAG